MAHYLEHLLFDGTKKRTKPYEIMKTIQSMGGFTNAYTSEDHTKYYIHISKKNEKLALDVLSDIYFALLLQIKI